MIDYRLRRNGYELIYLNLFCVAGLILLKQDNSYKIGLNLKGNFWGLG
jgi:hypothetical protein